MKAACRTEQRTALTPGTSFRFVLLGLVNLQRLPFHRLPHFQETISSSVPVQTFNPPSDEFAIIDGFI